MNSRVYCVCDFVQLLAMARFLKSPLMPGREKRCVANSWLGMARERAEGRALLVEVGEHRRYGAFLFGDECKAFVELRKKIALDLVEQVGLASVVLVKSSAVYLGGLAYLEY